MDPVSLDFETRGTADLKKTGVNIYAAHPDTDVWCAAFTQPGGKDIDVWMPGMAAPKALIQHVLDGGLISAWNCGFEFAIWNEILVPRYGFPKLPLSQTVCTMTMALARAFPGSLDQAAKAMRTNILKDAAGSRLMLSMCKPRRIEADGTIVWWTDPDRIERLVDYCIQDVKTERAIFRRLPALIPSEQAHYELTQLVNQRGLRIDMELVNGAEQVVQARLKQLNSALSLLTGGVVPKATNIKKLSAWLGLLVPDMPEALAKADLRELLSRPDLDPRARRALEIRQEAGKASTSKIDAFKRRVSGDGRLRGVLKFYGAGSTGRWTSQGVQLQNLPRDAPKPESLFGVIAAGDLEGVDVCNLNGGVMNAVSASLRGMVTAAPGKVLMICDFGQIESRLTAWLARDEAKLDVFRQGRDVYQMVGAGMYGIPEDQVVGDTRQSSKVAELACGFGGGKGALASMASAYSIEWDEDQCQEIVDRWRLANPFSVELWKDLMASILVAMRAQGKPVLAAGGRIVYKADGHSLRCLLPSGRVLNYPWPLLEQKPAPWDDTQMIDSVTYEGFNTARQWIRRGLWRGLATENIIQAMASDILRFALENLERAGFEVVLHIHDEAIVETDDPSRLDEMKRIMTMVPSWATGLPLDCSGEVSFRYRK